MRKIFQFTYLDHSISINAKIDWKESNPELKEKSSWLKIFEIQRIIGPTSENEGVQKIIKHKNNIGRE